MAITINNFQRKVPLDPKRIKKAILKTFSNERKGKPANLNICITDDKKIKRINSRFLKHNYSTDVLAFDMRQKKKDIDGEIIVSAETAVRNAKIYKTTPEFEIELYIIHGLLHLLGLDDRTKKQREAMNKRAILYVHTPH